MKITAKFRRLEWKSRWKNIPTNCTLPSPKVTQLQHLNKEDKLLRKILSRSREKDNLIKRATNGGLAKSTIQPMICALISWEICSFPSTNQYRPKSRWCRNGQMKFQKKNSKILIILTDRQALLNSVLINQFLIQAKIYSETLPTQP